MTWNPVLRTPVVAADAAAPHGTGRSRKGYASRRRAERGALSARSRTFWASWRRNMQADGRRSPSEQVETRNIRVVRGVAGRQGGAMDERLGGDHPVEQLASRVACARHDGAIGVGGLNVEDERGYRRENDVETGSPDRRQIWIAPDAAL